MANYNVSISVLFDSEQNMLQLSVSPHRPSSSNPLILARGDTVTWTRSGSDQAINAIEIAGFDSAIWTNAANITTLAPGASVVKTVKSNATLNLGDFVAITASRFVPIVGTVTSSVNFWVSVGTPIDDIPNQFSIPNQTGVPTNTWISSGLVNITGISAASVGVVELTASVTGGQVRWYNGYSGSSWASSVGITNQDPNTMKLEVRVLSPSSLESSASCTLTINGISDTFTVTTGATSGPQYVTAASGTLFPKSLLKLKEFFGGANNPKLSEYLRGGAHIPNYTENSSFSTSLPVSLGSISGLEKTRIELANSILSESRTISTINNTGQTISLDMTNYIKGYSSMLHRELQYKLEVIQSTGTPVPGTSTAFTNWSSVAYTLSYPQGRNTTVSGKFKLTAKHPMASSGDSPVEIIIPYTLYLEGGQ